MTKKACCPAFKPTDFQEKLITWKEKAFLHDKTFSFFHFFSNRKAVIARLSRAMKTEAALPDGEKPFLLTHDISSSRQEIFITAGNAAKGAGTAALTGTYVLDVFDSRRSKPALVKELETHLSAKGYKLIKLYFYYPVCPTCLRVISSGYTLVLAKVGSARSGRPMNGAPPRPIQ